MRISGLAYDFQRLNLNIDMEQRPCLLAKDFITIRKGLVGKAEHPDYEKQSMKDEKDRKLVRKDYLG